MSSNSSCNNTDRLTQINNELRDKVNVDTPWLPLESNPEIFTKFGHDVSCVLLSLCIMCCTSFVMTIHVLLILLIVILHNIIYSYNNTRYKDWYASKL